MPEARDEQAGGVRPGLVRLAPGLVLVVILAITAVATVISVRQLADRRADDVDRQARDAATAVDRRLTAYTEVVRGMSGFFQESPEAGPLELHRYVTGLQLPKRYPGVQALGFAERVRARDLHGFERRVKVELRLSGLPHPPLRVTPRRSTGELVVASRLESADRSITMGFDLLSEPIRRAAIVRARDAAAPVATAPVKLRVTSGDPRGFILVAPVYRSTAVPPPMAERRRAFAGVAFASFRAASLLGGVLGRVGRGTADLEVYDLGPTTTTAAAPRSARRLTRDRLAYDLAGGANALRRDSEKSRLIPLTVAGRRWTVYYRSQATAVSGAERSIPWLIALGGTLLAILAAALVRSLATGRERAVALAQEMTVELRERERELARSNAELEHFAYLASHDLQEPLRTVTAYTGLLERRLGERLEDKERSWLGFIGGAAQHMSHLIADLLEYSRAGTRQSEPEAVDLDDAWDEAVRHLAGAIDDAGATVVRGDLPVVQAARRDMTSMLQNLLGNAIKYRRDGVPPVVRAEAMRRNGRWELLIEDNGIGIEPRFHDRVFGLFQRLHTSEEYPGTGMGLAIVRKLAEANGGTVSVRSSPGQGSTFVVALPSAEEQA